MAVTAVLGYLDLDTQLCNRLNLGGTVQFLVFYRARLLRGMASALTINSMVACSDCLRGRGPLQLFYKCSLAATCLPGII